MFTGIIETLGEIHDINHNGRNIDYIIKSSIAGELKIDQSVSHNGVCLTVTKAEANFYTVTAIDETLNKTNLKYLKKGDLINLERSMLMNGRLDGHLVQGHIDETLECVDKSESEGSLVFSFKLNKANNPYLVNKGSVCINGVSLTIAELTDINFSVAIIPYTLEYTTFKYLKIGDSVNIEYDIVGKYIAKLFAQYQLK